MHVFNSFMNSNDVCDNGSDNDDNILVIELPVTNIWGVPLVGTISERILSVLSEKTVTSKGLDTLQIAKAVFGEKATQKDVNPTLYKMSRGGQIVQIKLPNKSRPHWKINK